MSSREFKFKHESIQSIPAIINYLEAIREGVKQKSICFSKDNEEVCLGIGGLMHVKIKSRIKDDKYKFTINLDWNANE